MDCVFLAQERTDDLHRKDSGGNVILKLDMEKAAGVEFAFACAPDSMTSSLLISML